MGYEKRFAPPCAVPPRNPHPPTPLPRRLGQQALEQEPARIRGEEQASSREQASSALPALEPALPLAEESIAPLAQERMKSQAQAFQSALELVSLLAEQVIE